MLPDHFALLKSHILNETTFIRAVASRPHHGNAIAWQKVTVRPVIVKKQRHLQFSYFDAAKDITKNYKGEETEQQIEQLLRLPFQNFYVETTDETIQVHINVKGHPSIHRHASRKELTPDLSHDRQKQRLLTAESAAPFLKAVGIMNQNGVIKADKQDKFVQINEFLKLISQTGVLDTFMANQPVRMVDLGCGNAYLTFALYYYLTDRLGLQVEMTGVDVKTDLLQRHAEKVAVLGWQGLTFVEGRIMDYHPETPPDIVVALHACDTATDDALAQGIRCNSKLIVAAPCCQHSLQAQLCDLPTPAPFRSVYQDGILGERLGDVLTDTFRAMWLRVNGYKTDVVQFVASEHTPKNLMIRAVKGESINSAKALEEYQLLKQFWGVTPYLEALLTSEKL
jgi:SAM-dependent methyltransferase